MSVISNSKQKGIKFQFCQKAGLNFIIFVFLIFLCACKSESNKEDFSSKGLNAIDLSQYGKPFSIFVPDTVSSKLYVEEKVNGALEIRVGKDFAVVINEQMADIELKKQDIKGDEVNKLISFVLESPDAIIWESKITTIENHFLLNVKIRDSDYSFEDAYTENLKPFNKEAIQKMFICCKNVKTESDKTKTSQ